MTIACAVWHPYPACKMPVLNACVLPIRICNIRHCVCTVKNRLSISSFNDRIYTTSDCDDCYLVDPASSHMLVSKIKPCMSQYLL